MRQQEIGGWTRLLIASIGIIGPIELLVSTYLAQRTTERRNPAVLETAEWLRITTFTWAMVSLQILIMVYAAIILLTKKTPKAVYTSIAALWIVGPIWNVILAVFTNIIFGLRTHPDPLSMIFAFILSAAGTIYLLRSKRVRSVYLSSKSDDGDLQTVFE